VNSLPKGYYLNNSIPLLGEVKRNREEISHARRTQL
jgi:hypothetical protein